MGILANLTDEIKAAMRAKDSLKLEALRAIKSAVILEQTSVGGGDTLTEEQEIKLVQKLVKQRKDSAQIFRDQNRPDLAEPEEAQAEIISQFLPEQLSEDEIKSIIQSIIKDRCFWYEGYGKSHGNGVKRNGWKSRRKNHINDRKSRIK